MRGMSSVSEEGRGSNMLLSGNSWGPMARVCLRRDCSINRGRGNCQRAIDERVSDPIAILTMFSGTRRVPD